MKSLNIVLTAFFLLLYTNASGQDDRTLFSRLRALKNKEGIDYYNVDGIGISCETSDRKFSKNNILYRYMKISITGNNLKAGDSTLGFHNYYVAKSMETSRGIRQYVSYYFIENADEQLTAIIFTSVNKHDKDFEQRFVRMIYNREIPPEVFDAQNMDTINFAGRQIPLGGACQWMEVNNIRCPFYGQMNWSVHKTMESAQQSASTQYAMDKIKYKKYIVSEDTVSIIFESNEVPARRIVFYSKSFGLSTLLLNKDQRTLTVYFVAAPVRGHFVSCVMSHWKNNETDESGFPPLLGTVMQMKDNAGVQKNKE